jgi:hypothetical protein
MKKSWTNALRGVLFAGAVLSGAFGAHRVFAADDCCYPGASCCKPGAPCCNGAHTIAQH